MLAQRLAEARLELVPEPSAALLAAAGLGLPARLRALAHLFERAPQLRDALAAARRDELHGRTPSFSAGVQEAQRGGEVAAGALGARAVLVGLVDRHQIGRFEDAALD